MPAYPDEAFMHPVDYLLIMQPAFFLIAVEMPGLSPIFGRISWHNLILIDGLRIVLRDLLEIPYQLVHQSVYLSWRHDGSNVVLLCENIDPLASFIGHGLNQLPIGCASGVIPDSRYTTASGLQPPMPKGVNGSPAT
jgi:hypothetical protein